MSSPDLPCTCGVAHIGECAGPLSICLQQGRAFDDALRLTNDHATPIDWPEGTSARLWFSWGTGTQLIVPVIVDGSWLRFSIDGSQTELIPRGAQVRIDINYTDPVDDDVWRTWREGRISC